MNIWKFAPLFLILATGSTLYADTHFFVPDTPVIPIDFSGDIAVFVEGDPETGLLGHFSPADWALTRTYDALSPSFSDFRDAVWGNGYLDLNFAVRPENGDWATYHSENNPFLSDYDFYAIWFGSYFGTERIDLTSVSISFSNEGTLVLPNIAFTGTGYRMIPELSSLHLLAIGLFGGLLLYQHDLRRHS